MDIGQIFENNFDCYADTWQDNNDTIPPTMVDGDVVMAMTKEAFIKVVKELILPVVSNTEGKLQAVEDLKDFAYNNCQLHNTDQLDEIIERL